MAKGILTKIDLLQYISMSRHLQLMNLQVLNDAAVLSVEQVQDTRIKMLERPEKEVSLGNALMDVMIGLALSSAAGAAARMLAMQLITPILRTRFAFNILPRTALGHKLAMNISFSEDKASKFSMNSFLAEVSQDQLLSVYKFNPHDLINKGVETGMQVISSALQDKAKKSTLSDSHSVRFLASVMNYCNNQTLLINYLHDLLQFWVQNDLLTSEKQKNGVIKLLAENLEAAIPPQDIHKHLHLLKLYFEKIVWTLYLKDSLAKGIELLPKDDNGNFVVPGANLQLSKYLVERLHNQQGLNFLDQSVYELKGKGHIEAFRKAGRELDITDKDILHHAMALCMKDLANTANSIKNPKDILAKKIFGSK